MPLKLTIKRFGALDFVEAVTAFDWGTTKIHEVHWHHTYLPNHAAFRARGGERLVREMYDFHTGVRGWRHMGQHLSIDPDGFGWLGRPWNLGPASAIGFNGADNGRHAFMFEFIADFRNGFDPPLAAQIEMGALVTAVVQRRFKLVPTAMRFHKHMQPTACPGDLDFDKAIVAVAKMHEVLSDGVLAAEETYAPLRSPPLANPGV